MPGIVGLITSMPRQCAEQQLRRMVDALVHESFYESGTWVDESLGVYVGWVARRGSFASGMPIRDERGDVCLVWSGEEYPDPDIRRRLKAQGHVFAPDGAAYLAHLYEDDPSFPASLNGRFHGLVADRRAGTVRVFNDRWGMERLYYHGAADGWYFGAEAKAILAVRPELRTPDLQGLGELITCGCVLEDRTLFKGISVLPGASSWEFRPGGTVRKQRYFDADSWQDQTPLDPESYYGQLRDVFSRQLPRYFAGGETVGVSLTGGLDSRMIMAWDRAAAGERPCYSFGGSYRDCQDVSLARRIAAMRAQPYQVIPVGDEFLADFPRCAERTVYLTDGCCGTERAADLFVNERARQIATVRMTGNYGGEVLRRVRAFEPERPLPDLFHRDLAPSFDQAEQTYARLVDTHPLTFSVFRQAPWHHYGVLALEQTQLAVRSPFLDNDFVQTVFRAPQSSISNDVCVRLIADGDPAMLAVRTDRGLLGTPNAAAAALSRAVLDFTYKAEYAYDYGMPQSVARVDHALSPLRLERLFLGRHKFTHYRVWYRDQLSRFVREMLLDRRTLARPYLEPATVNAVVSGHLAGDRNYTTAIHQLLSLELLHRRFFDPS